MPPDVSPFAEASPVRLAELVFAAAAGPVAWSAHMVVNFAVASRLCFPGRTPLSAFHGGFATWTVMLAVDVLALAVCGAGVLLSSRLKREAPDRQRERAHFIAQCGILSGCGFALATLFDTIALFMVPLCTS